MIVRGVLLCALLLVATVIARTQEATFASRVEAVRVDVLVTDSGQPVLGLRPTDFDLFDNGVAQQIDLVSFDQIPLNVILALDMSASMAGERLGHLQAAGDSVLAALKPGDQAALVTFSHIVQLGAPLSTDLESARVALDHAHGTGNTALVDGTYAGMMVGASEAGRALLIVFSDGVDTSSWLSADAVLDTAKRSDVVAYAVSVRSSLKPDFLRNLTSFTSGRLLEVEKTANLEAIFIGILNEFRHRYLVSYTPTGVARGGWHRLAVHVKRKAAIKARPGYWAGS
jgi:Ca-activated chloride channel family protein